MANLILQDLKSYEQTVNYIKKNILEYWMDILLYPQLLNLSPSSYFDFIQSYKYCADPDGVEFVSSPKHLLEIIFNGKVFYCDCDDRTGLSGIYFMARNKLFGENNKMKIVVCGEEKALKPVPTLFGFNILVNVPHHVYLLVNGIPFDPTYPENRYGVKLFKEAYYKEYPVN